MRLYELNYLVPAELSTEEVRAVQEKIISLLEGEGGILVEANSAIRKTLAYPIKKKREAFLNSLSFQILPERLESLEKKLKGESNILRCQILAKKWPKKVASVLSKKPERIIKPKPKVELKEIEKKLEEILGET